MNGERARALRRSTGLSEFAREGEISSIAALHERRVARRRYQAAKRRGLPGGAAADPFPAAQERARRQRRRRAARRTLKTRRHTWQPGVRFNALGRRV